jgi:protein SCO1/2
MSERSTPEPEPEPRRGLQIKLLLPIALLIAIMTGVTLALALPGSKPKAPDGAQGTKTSAFQGLAVAPQPAPALDTLRNYTGTSFNLASERGKAVFVTFLYTHCPDVCPLIASQLHSAYATMSPSLRKRIAIVAVSVDPRGDTAGSVAAFMKEHELAGEGDYLIGPAAKLAAVWQAWGVGSKRDTSNPNLVAHTAEIFGISASGKINTLYPANFQPSQIVHDVPALLER